VSLWPPPIPNTHVDLPLRKDTAHAVEFYPDPPWQRRSHGKAWGWMCFFWPLGDKQWVQRYWREDYA
jgi:hypothetical protein